ncbi:MAG: Transaldolase [Chthonomonadaceae bacterium]|nr:Transaldolase [Chthonomonadaceae bacterium]
MSTGYFHRVTRETPTRFWINNPTGEELEQALAAGAVNCTTNPTYGSKLIKSEPGYISPIIDQVVRETSDIDEAADRVCQAITARLLAGFLPLYERTGGQAGFVTIQSDPRKDEDAREMTEAALRYRALGPNFMAKIPVTQAGLETMATLIAEGLPLCATEVFSLSQTAAVCDLYRRITGQTGRRPPFYVTHITGIFDEYLAKVVERDGIALSRESLAWAGAAVARKEYRLLQERGFPTALLGGGARSIRHFTDFVGGAAQFTINWSTAQELLAADPPVVNRMDIGTPAPLVAELLEKLSDFRLAWDADALSVQEFAEYGPVQLFRNNFIAGYEHLVRTIAQRRAEAAFAAVGRA